MKKATKQQRERWAAANLTAARLIMAAPERHPAFTVDWAKRCLARLSEETTGQRSFDFGGRGGSNL